jgi:uncharacterized protein (DUF433 family)
MTMDWENYIVADDSVLSGKPVIQGTRLTVEFIIGLLAEGWTEADILRNYPGLTHEHILTRAATLYPLAVLN